MNSAAVLENCLKRGAGSIQRLCSLQFALWSCTHKYWRLSRWPTELGISPRNWLLERSSLLRFASLPISAGIGPLMLLFCRRLHHQKIKKRRKKISFNSNKNWSCQGYSTNAHPWTDVRKKHHSHSLKIGQVADAWREQAREMLAWSFPEKYSEYSDKQQMRGRMRVARNVFKVWWRDSASTIYVTMYCSL